MRFSVKTTLMLCAAAAVGAAVVGALLRLDSRTVNDLTWFLPSVGIVGVVMGTGTAIGWLAVHKASRLPINLWPVLVFSFPNWTFYALVRWTLYQTKFFWDGGWEESPDLESMQRLAEHYLFEWAAVAFQLAIILCWRSRRPDFTVAAGSLMLVFWISVICLELLLCTLSGVYYSDSIGG